MTGFMDMEQLFRVEAEEARKLMRKAVRRADAAEQKLSAYQGNTTKKPAKKW